MELLGRKGPPSGMLDPGNLTNAPPTSNNTGKTGVVGPIGNPMNAPPTNNYTGSIPPESIIKVPPGTTNPPPTPLKLSPSTQLAGQQQPEMQQTSGHHHQGQIGASTSSVNSIGH